MAGAILSADSKYIRRRWIAALTLLSLIILLALARFHYRSREYAFPIPGPGNGHSPKVYVSEFIKPKGVVVVALVFFGRKNRVELLRCYLERNLVDNGGWLDEIQWVKNTDNPEDLKYLDEILASSPRYSMLDATAEGVGFAGYAQAWTQLDRGKLYVKVDDDVVSNSNPVWNPLPTNRY